MQESTTKKKADLKVIILGDTSVGKTSLIQRYLHGVFAGNTISTIGASFFLKQWGPYNVAIWDTAGEERYSGLSSFYCRGASAAILAYDISQSRSLRALRERYLQLLDASEPNCLVVVVGTKKDLVTGSFREIASCAGESLALELNEKKGRASGSFNEKPFFETSAKSGENVQKVFDFILNTCLPLDNEDTAKRCGPELFTGASTRESKVDNDGPGLQYECVGATVSVLLETKAFTTKAEHVSFSCCYFCKRFTVAEQSWPMFPVCDWIGLS
ncbi:Ras-related protein Rab-20 [Stylophora pistillata]|uniref:Ras-related protein Rab-20 n=1 Tax=Stylophora pistillata TaxID=50429 RepID=A0A2B4SAX2_STYPI|nr:Ras-related protein Rab-20 [Stylophora pistillata]